MESVTFTRFVDVEMVLVRAFLLDGRTSEVGSGDFARGAGCSRGLGLSEEVTVAGTFADAELGLGGVGVAEFKLIFALWFDHIPCMERFRDESMMDTSKG